MKIRSKMKRFFLKGWMKLAVFLQWVEKHPLVDRVILLIVKIVYFILTKR